MNLLRPDALLHFLLLCGSVLLCGVFPVAGGGEITREAKLSAQNNFPSNLAEGKQCSPSADEIEEVFAALKVLPKQGKPSRKFWTNYLQELAKSRREYNLTPGEIAVLPDALPERFKSRLLKKDSDEKNLEIYEKVAPLAKKIFALHRLTGRNILIYESRAPLVALWKGYYILVSAKTVELLDEDELMGQIAHETAHLYWMAELKDALEKKDNRTARIIELKCDLLAMVALAALNEKPEKVYSALERMTEYLEENKLISLLPTHPTLCARKLLSRRFAGQL